MPAPSPPAHLPTCPPSSLLLLVVRLPSAPFPGEAVALRHRANHLPHRAPEHWPRYLPIERDVLLAPLLQQLCGGPPVAAARLQCLQRLRLRLRTRIGLGRTRRARL